MLRAKSGSLKYLVQVVESHVHVRDSCLFIGSWRGEGEGRGAQPFTASTRPAATNCGKVNTA